MGSGKPQMNFLANSIFLPVWPWCKSIPFPEVNQRNQDPSPYWRKDCVVLSKRQSVQHEPDPLLCMAFSAHPGFKAQGHDCPESGWSQLISPPQHHLCAYAVPSFLPNIIHHFLTLNLLVFYFYCILLAPSPPTTSLPTPTKLQGNWEFHLFCPLIYPKYLEQNLAPGGNFTDIC